MMHPYYCDLENPEYFFKKNVLFHRQDGIEKQVMTFDPSDYRYSEFLILKLLEYENHLVFLLDFPTLRNVFCLNRHTDELVWRADPPKAVWKDRRNYWCRISQFPEMMNLVFCGSVDGYRANFEVSTGKIAWEYDPDKRDPRDF